MFVHLLTPSGLSWTRNGVPKTDEAHERLKEEKRKARLEDLCKGLPTEFEDFLRYCRRLKFQDCPDYEKWIDAFRDLAVELGFPESDDFIWPPPPVRLPVHVHAQKLTCIRPLSKSREEALELLQMSWNASSTD
jgi:hypothetical protein